MKTYVLALCVSSAAVVAPLFITCQGCNVVDTITVPGITHNGTTPPPSYPQGQCVLCPSCENECIPHPCTFNGTLDYRNMTSPNRLYTYHSPGIPGGQDWPCGDTITKAYINEQVACGGYLINLSSFMGSTGQGTMEPVTGIVQFGCSDCPKNGVLPDPE